MITNLFLAFLSPMVYLAGSIVIGESPHPLGSVLSYLACFAILEVMDRVTGLRALQNRAKAIKEELKEWEAAVRERNKEDDK